MRNEVSVASVPEYILVHQNSNQVAVQLELTTELEAFAGHFPGHPVLPGVVQLHWAALLGKKHFKINGLVQQVDALKFQNIIAPPAKTRIEIEQLSTDKISFRFYLNEVQASSGRITFTLSKS